MHGQVEDLVKTYDKCQCHKIVTKPNYGVLPLIPVLRDKEPFEKMQVDCAGPWTVCIKDKSTTQEIEYQIHILTMVDTCTNWTELALVPTANSKTVPLQFGINW
jgi:hypothetical protein